MPGVMRTRQNKRQDEVLSVLSTVGWSGRRTSGKYNRQQEAPECSNSLPYGKEDIFSIEPGRKLTKEELDAMEPIVIPDIL